MTTPLARALHQLKQAAGNFSKVNAENGYTPALLASALCSQIANALMYGQAYITEGHAKAFDEEIQEAKI